MGSGGFRTTFRVTSVLKRDLFGQVERGVLDHPELGAVPAVRRDLRGVRLVLRPVARRLASREARALRRLDGVAHIPQLLEWDGRTLVRTWIAGRPLFDAEAPPGPEYFRSARKILDDLHARGITHNDLHKEPNILVDTDGGPALVDFQLASVFRRRGRWFRMYVREDHRHLLKHKRKYCKGALTDTERELLGRPSWIARWWRRTGKRVYRVVTRRGLRWRDREGRGLSPADRGSEPRAE